MQYFFMLYHLYLFIRITIHQFFAKMIQYTFILKYLYFFIRITILYIFAMNPRIIRYSFIIFK